MKEWRLLHVLLRALLMAVSLTGVSLPVVLKGRLILKRKQTRSCKTTKSNKGRDWNDISLPGGEKKKEVWTSQARIQHRAKNWLRQQKKKYPWTVDEETASKKLKSHRILTVMSDSLTCQNGCWMSFDEQTTHSQANSFCSQYLLHLAPLPTTSIFPTLREALDRLYHSSAMAEDQCIKEIS